MSYRLFIYLLFLGICEVTTLSCSKSDEPEGGGVPTLVQVSPNTGPTTGGVSLSVKGTNFFSKTQVFFGEKEALVTQVTSANELQVTLPANLGHLGKIDVQVKNPDHPPVIQPDLFRYYGTVSFQVPPTPLSLYPKTPDLGQSPTSVITGDFDGDNQPDLLFSIAGKGGQLSFLHNNQGKSFTLSTKWLGDPSDAKFQIVQVLASDVNQDGKLDVIAVNSATNNILVLLGNGNGTFQSPISIPVGKNPIFAAMADVNHDQNLDLVVINLDDKTIHVLLAQGHTGNFSKDLHPLSVPAIPDITTVQAFVVTDMDGDGNVDIVIPGGGNNMLFYSGKQDGTFSLAITIHLSSDPKLGQDPLIGTWSADINHDGKPELLAMGIQSIRILTRQNDSTYLPTSTIYAPNKLDSSVFRKLWIADLNGDDQLDLVTNSLTNNNQYDSIGVFIGKGDGSFQEPALFKTGAQARNPFFFSLADINADGKPEAITGNIVDNNGAIFWNTSQ